MLLIYFIYILNSKLKSSFILLFISTIDIFLFFKCLEQLERCLDQKYINEALMLEIFLCMEKDINNIPFYIHYRYEKFIIRFILLLHKLQNIVLSVCYLYNNNFTVNYYLAHCQEKL